MTTVDTMVQDEPTIASRNSITGQALGNKSSDTARNVQNAFCKTKAERRKDSVTLNCQTYQWNSFAWT